jgi:hypothetical protein
MKLGQPQSMLTGGTEEVFQYLEDLVKTDRFRKSPSLNHLLEYLVRKAVEGKNEEIKESIIAIDVFGRSYEFDGRLDNIVRVQAHRLRKILDAYYASEGSHDRFVISIPKGGYLATIHPRDEPATPALSSPKQPEPAGLQPVAPAVAARKHPPAWLGLAAMFAAGALIAVPVTIKLAPVWNAGRNTATAGEDAKRAPLATFWSSFLQPGVSCVVAFTNPVFLWARTPQGRFYTTYQGPLSAPVGSSVAINPGDPHVDPELVKRGRSFFFSDSWTGTGEVFGMYRLTKFFTEAGHPLKVVRSRALSFADLRDANVVFLGSPWANDMQDKINPGRTPLACEGSVRITNFAPKAGEEPQYEPAYDPRTNALTVTYSLLSVLPGVTQSTKILSLAGIDTYGTSAGVDFVTSAAGVAELIQRFDSQRRHNLPDFFQAVLRTEIVRGDPARTTLVLTREVDRRVMADEGHRPTR